jgi:hypothetical protein
MATAPKLPGPFPYHPWFPYRIAYRYDRSPSRNRGGAPRGRGRRVGSRKAERPPKTAEDLDAEMEVGNKLRGTWLTLLNVFFPRIIRQAMLLQRLPPLLLDLVIYYLYRLRVSVHSV